MSRDIYQYDGVGGTWYHQCLCCHLPHIGYSILIHSSILVQVDTQSSTTFCCLPMHISTVCKQDTWIISIEFRYVHLPLTHTSYPYVVLDFQSPVWTQHVQPPGPRTRVTHRPISWIHRIVDFRHDHNTSNWTFFPSSIVLLKFVENSASRGSNNQ